MYKALPTTSVFTSLSCLSEEQTKSSNIDCTALSNNLPAQSTEILDNSPAQSMETSPDHSMENQMIHQLNQWNYIANASPLSSKTSTHAGPLHATLTDL